VLATLASAALEPGRACLAYELTPIEDVGQELHTAAKTGAPTDPPEPEPLAYATRLLQHAYTPVATPSPTRYDLGDSAPPSHRHSSRNSASQPHSLNYRSPPGAKYRSAFGTPTPPRADARLDAPMDSHRSAASMVLLSYRSTAEALDSHRRPDSSRSAAQSADAYASPVFKGRVGYTSFAPEAEHDHGLEALPEGVLALPEPQVLFAPDETGSPPRGGALDDRASRSGSGTTTDSEYSYVDAREPQMAYRA
jgi:hypothetical protein